MLTLLYSLAAAQGPAPEAEEAEAPVQEHPPSPESKPAPVVHTLRAGGALPSAVGRGGPPPLPERLNLSDLARASGLEPEDLERPVLVHGAWFLRPRVRLAQLVGAAASGPVALRVGLEAGRRYTTIQALPVQAAAEVGVRVSAPMFGAVGHRLEAYADAGPWLGPVRIGLGFGARYERERWRRRSLELVSDLLLGPELAFALDAGPVNLTLATQPLFGVGNRPDAKTGSPLLPVLGDETVYRAGVGLQPGLFGLRLEGSWRETVIGSLLEVGMNLTFEPGAL